MTPTLMVTGYGGFVAGSVVWQALREAAWDVCALSHRQPPEERDGFRCVPLDLCDSDAVRAVFDEVRPAAVIHAAAWADIDRCEGQEEDAERVNCGVTETLARCCAEHGARLVHCSTDTVFGGDRGMYTEEDAPRAVNWYAETKLGAEAAVRDHVEDGVVARLSLVMGLPVLGTGNSFLAKVMATLEQGEEVWAPAHETRTPLDVITAGRALLELAGTDFTGTIHLAGSTRINRHEMTCQIAEHLGYPRRLVVPAALDRIANRAPRPADASLDNTLARRVLDTPMRELIPALDLILRTKEEQDRGA